MPTQTTFLGQGSRPSRHFLVPAYVDLGDGRVLATFGDESGALGLELRRERSRSYPGLSAPAPRTDPIYRAFSDWAVGKQVLDVGMGSGAGLACLSGASALVGVDIADVAVRFASSALPAATFHRLDVTREPLPAAEVVTLVDVLGETQDPSLVLSKVGQALGEGGVLCLAEARATVAQELLAPVRRAFSKPELIHLLVDSGFQIREWLSEGSFLVLVAERRQTVWTRGIETVEQLLSLGLPDEARKVLRDVPKSKTGSLDASWFLKAADVELLDGNGDEALAALMEAHGRDGDDARVLTRLSEVMLRLGARTDAQRFARAALERDPSSASVVRAFALASEGEVGIEERIGLFTQAARLDPSDVDLAALLSRAAAEASHYYMGITALERVREYHTRLPADFHVTLGWLYLLTDRTDQALLECRIAGAIDALHPGVEDLLQAICEAEPRAHGVG